MTTFRLTVSMDGAAFEDDPGELGRILAKLGRGLTDAGHAKSGAGRVLDINGNTCGEWSIDQGEVTGAELDELTDAARYVVRDERGNLVGRFAALSVAQAVWRPGYPYIVDELEDHDDDVAETELGGILAERDERARELEAENAELAAFVDEHPSAEVLDAEELRPLPLAVAIPGQVIAMLRGGEIESLAFMPSGSDAGYSGPAAVLLNGNAGQALSLELDNTAGPFWSAVQGALRADVPIGWEE